MIRHVLLLVFLCGIQSGRSSSSSPQEQPVESKGKDTVASGIKKNEVGANGFEANWAKVARNFQNPVLEYLLRKNSDRMSGPPQGGVVREIRHSQTLLLPNFLGNPFPGLFTNPISQFESQTNPAEEGGRIPGDSPLDNFWDLLKNKTRPGGGKIQESVVSSPVLHLNKNPETKEESTRIQMYPAVAVVINNYGKDGSLKSSLTHFQPDFNSLRPHFNKKGGAPEGKSPGKARENPPNSHHTVGNLVGSARPQGLSWPFANFFPLVINDPYNAFATNMYSAVSSMIEYGPEADICGKGKGRTALEDPEGGKESSGEVRALGPYQQYPTTESNIFDEITIKSENYKRRERGIEGSRLGRKRRDATSIYVKSKEGDTVGITLEEPKGPNSDEKVPKGSDLILRKGGIAIAGPGGAATAYTGGTAIVGPYGTVYKSPEGTAILGPFSKVVDITDDTTFEEILKMHTEMQSQEPPAAPLFQGDVKFKNYQNFFSYRTNLPVKFEVKPQGRSFIKNRPKILRLKEEGVLKAIEEIKETEFRRIVEDAPFEERGAGNNETTLIFRPKSKAEAGRNGVALSAPTSHAILYPGQKARIYFEPESVASAGPSGFAHAHSDLFVTYVPKNGTSPQPERRRRSSKGLWFKSTN